MLRAEAGDISHSLSRMDSNAQYYQFDSFQPPIADSLIRDGECENGHESCLFRIIEL